MGKVQGEVNEATAGRKGNGNGRNEQERRKEAWKEGRVGVGVGVGVEGAFGNRRKKKNSAKIRHHAHFRASCNPSRRFSSWPFDQHRKPLLVLKTYSLLQAAQVILPT